MENKKLKWYFHIHHKVLVEPLTEPIENRIKFIKENKPKEEIKLRLKLMKPVKGKLPQELIEAWQKYVEAEKKYDEMRQRYNDTGQKYVEVGRKYNGTGQKYDETEQKHDEAGQKYDRAGQKYDEAGWKYDGARQKYNSQIENLHKKECHDCSWDSKQQTIFPK